VPRPQAQVDQQLDGPSGPTLVVSLLNIGDSNGTRDVNANLLYRAVLLHPCVFEAVGLDSSFVEVPDCDSGLCDHAQCDLLDKPVCEVLASSDIITRTVGYAFNGMF
jgi:hypothetical protein